MMPERCCCCGDSSNSAWTWSKISAIGFGTIVRCVHLQHQQHLHFIYCVLWLSSFYRGFILQDTSSNISFLLFQLPKPRPYSLFNSFQNIHDLPSLLFNFITFHTTTIVILLLHKFSFKCYHPQLLHQWDTIQFTWIKVCFIHLTLLRTDCFHMEARRTIMFHRLKTASYCAFNCGLPPPQHNFYYILSLI